VHAPRLWGLSAITDQQIAGVTMVAEQAVVLFVVFLYWFRRFLAEEGAI
jgi:cytochrome c oxidase assembly factor CtaG